MSMKVAGVSLVMMASFAGGVWAGTYSGGTGEPNDPYRISTPNDLNDIGNHVEDFNKCFVMVNDIDLLAYTGTMYNIIGDLVNPFTGVFDGNDRTISNFRYSSSFKDNIGLFGYVSDANAQIKDLGLLNPNVTVGEQSIYVGSLVGLMDSGTVVNCYTDGGTIHGSSMTSSNLGGLIGRSRGRIYDCYSKTYVDGYEAGCLGGLVGSNVGIISSCYSSRSVSGKIEVGGLVGSNGGLISNCYSTSGPWGGSWIGGVVGRNTGTVSECYTTAGASGIELVGGVVGYNTGTVLSCFAKGLVSYDGWFEEGGCFGGLVGQNDGDVIDCYSVCSVDRTSLFGVQDVGGLVGYNNGSIEYCYSAGSVDGNEAVGGLIGCNSSYGSGGSVAYSFWDVETSGRNNMCGIADGNGCDDSNGKTTQEMKTQSTFADVGWDFIGEIVNGPNDVWTIKEGVDYPQLVWPLVNLVGWYEVDGLDFVYFASRWRDENCGDSDDCDGVDFDFLGVVDWRDFSVFCNHWLEE